MELQFPDVWYTFEVDGGRYRTEKMDQQDAFQILTMQEQLWNFLFNNISAPPVPPRQKCAKNTVYLGNAGDVADVAPLKKRDPLDVFDTFSNYN